MEGFPADAITATGKAPPNDSESAILRTLAPGNFADVVVLDRNLFLMPADSLDRARVRYTIVGGRIVFER